MSLKAPYCLKCHSETHGLVLEENPRLLYPELTSTDILINVCDMDVLFVHYCCTFSIQNMALDVISLKTEIFPRYKIKHNSCCNNLITEKSDKIRKCMADIEFLPEELALFP